MNELKKCGPNLIGSIDSLNKLKDLDKAKLLVFSDTHGNYDVFEDIVLTYGPDCNALIFCGDGLCDIENYIAYSVKEKPLADAMPSVIAFARGNGDPASLSVKTTSKELSQSVIQMPVTSFAELEICQKKLLAIHGHQFCVDLGLDGLVNFAQNKNIDTICFGHTHIPEKLECNNALYINPGSAARPRSSSGPTLALVTMYKESKSSVAQFFSIPH